MFYIKKIIRYYYNLKGDVVIVVVPVIIPVPVALGLLVLVDGVNVEIHELEGVSYV
jgi:hypothetical protein